MELSLSLFFLQNATAPFAETRGFTLTQATRRPSQLWGTCAVVLLPVRGKCVTVFVQAGKQPAVCVCVVLRWEGVVPQEGCVSAPCLLLCYSADRTGGKE